jgi:hypothetical protein
MPPGGEAPRPDYSAFTNDDPYAFEPDLCKLYPANRHIRHKIRQQLQVLRDRRLTFIRQKLM